MKNAKAYTEAYDKANEIKMKKKKRVKAPADAEVEDNDFQMAGSDAPKKSLQHVMRGPFGKRTHATSTLPSVGKTSTSEAG